MAQPLEHLLSSLSEEEWLDLYNRLRFFTYKRYGLLGLDLRQVLHQSILEALQGNRPLPQVDSQTGESDLKLNLFLSLCLVIRSNVAHQLEFERRSKAHNQELDLDMEQLLLDEPGKSQDLGKRRAVFLGNRDSKSKARGNDFKEKIEETLSDNQEVATVVDLWRHGCSPKEIASETGFSLPQIFRLLKQFQKKLIRLQREALNG
jgi:hypothetical protein